MAGLGTLLTKLGREHGVDIDEDELAGLGLSSEEEPADTDSVHVDEVLSQTLPGQAAGMLELFLGDDLSTASKDPAVDGDGLMWYPIIREGQWAVRPGQNGTKKRTPLKVIAGKSKNQRREIGLQDLKDAFDDEAIQHVTVPSSHNNTPLENTGFIKGMKIVDGEVKDKKTKEKVSVKVLMGGYDIKLPEVKRKLTLGSIANRSAGILYDYVNTETGKTYPAVVEHVALTNKPWITGMVSFGRKLESNDSLETVALSLSDEGPSEDEYVESLSLSIDAADADFLAQESDDWAKEGSPNWLKQQVQTILDDARSAKMDAQRRAAPMAGPIYLENRPPCYRCVEAKPGKALISDGWGDDANYWAAPITVKDGAVALADFDKWSALKKAFIPDERPAPVPEKLPLDDDQDTTSKPQKTRLQLAQEARRTRATPGQNDAPKIDPPRGGGNMAEGTLELSAEAQRIVQEAEQRAAAAEERATKLSEKVERLTGTVNEGTVDAYIDELKKANFDEAHGFGGVLKEIRELMLADDGEPAVQAEHFATDGNQAGELTLSDAIKRVFAAFKRTEDSKLALGELLAQPADEEGKPKKDDEATDGGEGGTQASTETGKPGSGEPEAEQLSTEQKVEKIVEHSPEVARVMGRPLATPAAKPTTGGDA